MKDKNQDELDALLEGVDLSTYALERVRLGESIVLDPSQTGLDPQNPNPRGHHGGEEEKAPLDVIIAAFNERHFNAWSATPEEQKVKLVNIVERVKKSADYEKQVLNNPDEQNRRLALENLINQAVTAQRRTDMELYTLRQDDAFKQAFNEAVSRILALEKSQRVA